MNPDTHPSFPGIILVSGEIAGTGSSTLSKGLSEHLKTPRESSQRRTLASAWLSQRPADQSRSQSVWNSFVHSLLLETSYIEGLKDFYENLPPPDENDLSTFDQDEEKLDPNHQLEAVIDGRNKRRLNQHIENQTGAVFDSKLAVVTPELIPYFSDNFGAWAEVFEHTPELTLPLIRIVLTVDADESARRILSRESTGETLSTAERAKRLATLKAQSTNRIEQDWQRYSSTYEFDHTGEPISRSHLTDPRVGALLIDTTHHTPEQVQILALKHINDILSTTALTTDGTNFWINRLNNLIALIESHQTLNHSSAS